jgi:predicted ATP-grasp superfamily ATP-dependent carboligase
LKVLLVHEHTVLAGQRVPASLAREGRAMRNALLSDLVSLGRYELLATGPREMPPGVEWVSHGKLTPVFASVDIVWLIAPETRGCLESLARRVRRAGASLVGPSPPAIRRAADKARLGRILSRCGIPHPTTHAVSSRAQALAAAREMQFPVVVKPSRGAGSEGVSLVPTASRLVPAVQAAGRVGRPVLVQEFIPGVPASVSLICDGRRARPLAVNGQTMLKSRSFAYRGGVTPLRHPLARRAAAVAVRACEAIGGLRGFVGVDVVLGASQAYVIEVNPRVTTAYLGVRAVLETNLAGLALRGWAGHLPAPVAPKRTVWFTAAGRIG